MYVAKSQPRKLSLEPVSLSVNVPQNRTLATLINPSIYLNCANSFTGKLFFNLPLIVFECCDGEKNSIHLTYNPLQTSKEQIDLGLGWGIPKNCINYNPATKQYSITMQGTEFPINQTRTAGDSTSIPFSIAADDVEILLEPSKAHFRVFRSAGHSLTFANDQSNQNQWLLTEESFPDDSKLTFTYEIVLGEAYIKKISHSDRQQVIRLSYTTDKLFKLKSIEIANRTSSKVQIDWEASENELSLIENGGSSFCRYFYGSSHRLIEAITLPTMQVNYAYSRIDVNKALADNKSYRLVGESPRIFYGEDYIIGAWIGSYGELLLEKSRRDTFEVVISSNMGFEKRFPPLTLALETIQSFSILHMKKYIIVYLAGTISGKVIVFHSKPSPDNTIFQNPIQSWDVESIGEIKPYANGFYFSSQNGCSAY